MKQAAKPYRNQRVSRPRQRRQQHLLEVSVRASKARELRVRQAIGSCFKVLLFSALLAGAWVGSRHALKEFFWENPSFYLSDVRYVPDGSLTREQVLQTAEIQLNRNILLTNLSAAREKLNKLPQVERVEIDRRLPNRIDIRIEERRPIAWIAAPADPDPSASDSSFLIDARGYVMRSRKVRLEYLHLPIIKGVETENLVTGVRRHTNSCYLTFVAIDRNGRPIQVPQITPETEDENRRHAAAAERRRRRLEERTSEERLER